MQLEVFNRKRLAELFVKRPSRFIILKIFPFHQDDQFLGSEAFVLDSERYAAAAAARIGLIQQVVEIVQEELSSSLNQKVMSATFQIKLSVLNETHVAGRVKAVIVQD